MQEFLLNVVSKINTYLTDYVLIALLVGIGLYYTIRTKFVQVRCFGEGMRQVFGNLRFKGGKQGGGMSSFQAFATAVAAQVGTGNIVGACGAILIGGPGAIFWMWLIAFFGMATIYSEAVLAQKTRIEENGSVKGGPVYYITKAFKGNFGKILAAVFSVCVILALGFMGSLVQTNSIGETCNNAFGIPTWVMGIVVALLAGFVLVGGVSRLASFTEKLVPIMATVYLIGGLLVLGIRVKYIPEAFGMIFRFAFQPNAVIGGALGVAIKTAISQGAKRGLFSNEAGMGSTPHAHAMANVETPHKQGVTAMIGVFLDTFVVLTMTALVVISTMYAGDGPLSVVGSAADFSKSTLAQDAFGSAFSVLFGETAGAFIGKAFVAVCLLFFAFSTILSWTFFGKLNVQYMFRKNAKAEKIALAVYAVVAVAFVFLGSIMKNDLVWELTDMFNNLMVIPNVAALAFLGKMVVDGLPKKKLPEIK